MEYIATANAAIIAAPTAEDDANIKTKTLLGDFKHNMAVLYSSATLERFKRGVNEVLSANKLLTICP